MIWGHDRIVAPRIQDVLTVTVEGEECFEVGSASVHKLGQGACLGLREGAGAGKRFGTGLLRSPLAAPVESEVSVQVNTRASSYSHAAPVLAPQPIDGVRVFVAVRIGERQNVPVHVPDVSRLFVVALDNLIDQERDRGRANPFASMNAAVHPYRFVLGIAIRNAQHLQGPLLNREADRLDATQIGIGFS